MRYVLLLTALAVALAIGAPPPYVDPPIYFIVRSGQSLSIGAVGYCGAGQPIPCSSGAAYGNLGLTPFQPTFPTTPFQALTEDECRVSLGSAGCSPPHAESSMTSMCNQYVTLTTARVCASANYGWAGASFNELKKGGSGGEYAAAIAGVTAAKAAADLAGRAFYVVGVYFNQGEAEMNGSTSNTTYAANLAQLQADYEADINTAIGQSGRIPLFIVQKSSWAAWGTPRSTPTSTLSADGVPIGQLRACLDHYSDGRIFCVGPDYATGYGSDGVHKPGIQYRTQGAREAVALHRVTAQRRGWRPFYPRACTLSGSNLDVRFWVPSGELVIDTTNIAAHPAGNYGFELTDTGGSSRTISSVARLAGTTDTVRITLSGAPSSTVELRYAWTAPNGACPGSCSTAGSGYVGPVNGARGNLADTAGTSWAGDLILDHALSFRIPGISAASPYSWAPADPDLSSVPGASAAFYVYPQPGAMRRVR